MDFGSAIKSFWTNYVNFKGRARRSEYWFIALFLLLANLATTVIDGAVFADNFGLFLEAGGWGPVGVIWSIAVFLPSLAVLVRRLHDTGRSAWWLLIGLVPLAGVIVLFVFTVFGSDPIANGYGPSHLDQDQLEDF
jgi:uncharacterized membrane protein YhaH (DUF805 family)